MTAQECIQTRISSRKYLDTEVPRRLVEETLRDALRAPSYRNSQPWEACAVSGEKKVRLGEMLKQLCAAGEEPNPDIPVPVSWPVNLLDRMKDTAEKRAKAFGIVPGDSEAMRKSREANFEFYGAPLGLFFYQDASLNPWSLLDIGMFIENVILGFHSRGLACVPQAFLIDYSAQVKNFLDIGSDKKLVLGMSVGYADTGDPRSRFVSPRANLETIFRWIE